ncbi:hypothetical protein DV515_00004988 [Chloebia gouldiae]|uniref:Uncharacterized protein n=1 Tax=Chloebia gouldiae TaxID=44316 RepID=A0A3L8SP72_CHLGU|nr:hypothetical protein DV515_00004988 [Chloebia gouldiae]
MSQILKDQTEQLTKKVEDFSKHVIQETLFLQDKYLALNQLKRYLDALERNYLKAREEHHNLQLQNYKDKPINLGEFDPERNTNIQEGKTGTSPLFMQRKPTDLSDTNLTIQKTSQPVILIIHKARTLSTVTDLDADAPEEAKIEKSSVAAKTCCSSTYGKIILSHQYIPSKKSAQRKSAINIRDTNANDSYANVSLLSEN